MGRNLDVLQFFSHFVQEAVQHFCIQYEVVLGRLRLFKWLLTGDVGAVLTEERRQEGTGSMLLNSLIHGRRGMWD